MKKPHTFYCANCNFDHHCTSILCFRRDSHESEFCLNCDVMTASDPFPITTRIFVNTVIFLIWTFLHRQSQPLVIEFSQLFTPVLCNDCEFIYEINTDVSSVENFKCLNCIEEERGYEDYLREMKQEINEPETLINDSPATQANEKRKDLLARHYELKSFETGDTFLHEIWRHEFNGGLIDMLIRNDFHTKEIISVEIHKTGDVFQRNGMTFILCTCCHDAVPVSEKFAEYIIDRQKWNGIFPDYCQDHHQGILEVDAEESAHTIDWYKQQQIERL